MDIQKIPPIHQKRIVTFMNYFIVDTVSFLNKFINSTEDSLWKMEKSMHKLRTSLKLLEMKLNCIPDLQEPEKDAKMLVQGESLPAIVESNDLVEDENVEAIVENMKKEIPAELEKYYKMYHVGVPLGAVKSKMKIEGINPDLLKLP